MNGLRPGSGLKAALINRLATKHGVKFRGCAPARKATGGGARDGVDGGAEGGGGGGSAAAAAAATTSAATPVAKSSLKRPSDSDGADTLADDTGAAASKRKINRVGPLIGDVLVVEDWWSCPKDSAFGKAIKWVEDKVDLEIQSASAQDACTDQHSDDDGLLEASDSGDSMSSAYSEESRRSADYDTRCCDCGMRFPCPDDYLGSRPLCEDCRYDHW